MIDKVKPHFHNVRGIGNRISSAANVNYFAEPVSSELFYDKKYGHIWGYKPQMGAGVYGVTSNFEASPIDYLAEEKYLRVPYRRVPIINVYSLEELRTFASSIRTEDKSIKLMWRGQSKEYYINRSEEDSMILYGEKRVQEPSLTPSANRYNLEFSEVFDKWSGVIDLFLSEVEKDLNPEEQYELLEFRNGFKYRLWAFATAQHYGLPSIGLDLTNNIEVALQFALHGFRTDAVGKTTISRVDNQSNPVIYALGGFENDLFDDLEIAPSFLQCARPMAQNAFFHATGWGYAPNKAAERIFAAFRLCNHTEWNLNKDVNDLFPSSSEDRFLNFLLKFKKDFPNLAKELLLDGVYYVN